MSETVFRFPFVFHSDGARLVGRVHRNVDNLMERQPGVVASGSWLTVKEQMADLYADRLARRGYSVLTFDFAGFGESAGEPRQTELPMRKVADIVAATRFLRSLSCIRGGEVGYLAICASAMYAIAAIEAGAPITALSSIAGWLHDAESVAPFYGGEAGVQARLARAAQATRRWLEKEEIEAVPAYAEHDDRAGMFIPMDYYANPQRGNIPAWRNQMTEMTWAYWLTFNGVRVAERLPCPTLFVHGDECVFPDTVRRIHEANSERSELLWHPGFQVDFYDRPDLVDLAVQATDRHFRKHLAL